ncbi:MAG: hypothetical protein ACK44F_17395 [Roseococcus sp.]
MSDPGHDPWRRRLEALNQGWPQEGFRTALPDGTRGGAVSRLLVGCGALVLMAGIVLGGLAVFPLARESVTGPCPAMRSLLLRHAVERGSASRSGQPATTFRSEGLPDWLQCYVTYWRRLDVPPVEADAFGMMIRSMDPSVGLYLAGAGGVLAVAAFILWRRRAGGRRGEAQDAVRTLGMDPAAVARRVAPPPVDLSRPITGEAAWRAIRAYASDAAYRRAVETVRLRYQVVGNQMLLPNTLREVMERGGRDFREAVLCVAEDDGAGRR